jgi:hypothetical protein
VFLAPWACAGQSKRLGEAKEAVVQGPWKAIRPGYSPFPSHDHGLAARAQQHPRLAPRVLNKDFRETFRKPFGQQLDALEFQYRHGANHFIFIKRKAPRSRTSTFRFRKPRSISPGTATTSGEGIPHEAQICSGSRGKTVEAHFANGNS